MENWEVITLAVGQMSANCYLLCDYSLEKAAIIDPGDSADYIERILADKSLKPTNILATHGHFDHLMAVLELQLAYKIPFSINCRDKFLIKNMASSATRFIGVDPGPSPSVTNCLKNNQKLSLSGFNLKVIHTPGHTPGSSCLYEREKNILFTGDTLFAQGGIGRTDFSYSSHPDLLKSLKLIFSLPEETIIYPGHGQPSTLAEEKQNLQQIL